MLISTNQVIHPKCMELSFQQEEIKSLLGKWSRCCQAKSSWRPRPVLKPLGEWDALSTSRIPGELKLGHISNLWLYIYLFLVKDWKSNWEERDWSYTCPVHHKIEMQKRADADSGEIWSQVPYQTCHWVIISGVIWVSFAVLKGEFSSRILSPSYMSAWKPCW